MMCSLFERYFIIMDLEVPTQAGSVIERPYQLDLLAENVSQSSGYEIDEMDLSEMSSVSQSSSSTSASVKC